MTPRRLWLNKIPTQCDVVIEFPGMDHRQLCLILIYVYKIMETAFLARFFSKLKKMLLTKLYDGS